MRTSTILVLALFVAIASAGKLSNHNENKKVMNSEAHFKAMRETPFGQNLFNMLSLKFKATGQVDDIVTLLSTLSDTITAQQQEDDNNFATTSAAYQDTIAKQVEIISDAKKNIQAWNDEIAADTDTRAQDQNTVRSLTAEVDHITSFLEALADQRQREHDSFVQRTSDQTALIGGLDQVIALFSAELESDENLDQDAGNQILDLLNEIRAGLEASIAEDTDSENAAQLAYTNFVDEQTARLEELADQIDSLNAEIEGLTQEIDTDTQNIADETVRLNNAIATRDATQKALDDLTALYQHNTQVRSAQITLIGQTKARLTENSDDVQSFLNNA